MNKLCEVASSCTIRCLCASWSLVGSTCSEVEGKEGLPDVHTAKEGAKGLVTLPKPQVGQFSNFL